MKTQNAGTQEKDFERFNPFINGSSFIFLSWIIDKEWSLNYVSKNIQQFGYTQEDFLNNTKQYIQIIHHEDRNRVILEIQTNKNKPHIDCFNQMYRIISFNGDIRWVDVHTIIERDDADNAVNFFTIIKDITEKRTVERQLIHSEKRFQSIMKQTISNVSNYSLQELHNMSILTQAVKQTDDMVRITDSSGVILFANDALLKHSGYTLEETIGQTPRMFKSGEHDDLFYKKFWQTIQNGQTYSSVFINRKKDGTIYHEAETISPITDEKSNIQYYVATGKDISDRIALEHDLHQQATTDLLTGIYNRQKFLEVIEAEVDKLKRYNSTFALIMIDIDHFKDINDNYGHDAGDRILKSICEVIDSKIRRSDIFARWGGEEFMILAPGLSNKDEVIAVAQKIRVSVEASLFDHVSKVTISLGITLPKADDTVKDIFKRVDDALYQAKHNGRNQIHFI
ncbi:diguanylate cyclase [Sulfurimonas sp. HSL3-2]|uniref:GGDEF domain-containing protein n=1 Tax=Hydrocurvibacter mobilis TaxID=3131936 RepID=UPI0031F8D820